MSMPFPFPEFVRSSISPQEKWQKLMSRRNEWKLYPRKCDASGELILSAYDSDVPFPVYNNSYWWGDAWDATDYGRAFDFNRPFFEQFYELMCVVPREGTSIFNSINCDYNSHIRESKNCYLNSLIARCEDLLYCYWMVNSRDTLDSMQANDSTLAYECSFVNNAYHCVMLEESNNCSDCYFSYQLRGCNHCLFSTNLSNKSYHLFNKPCTKEEFDEALAEVLNGSWKSWTRARDQYFEIKQKAVHRAMHSVNCENSTGDHIYNCKNCSYCFDSYGSEDCIDTISSADSKNIDSSYSAGWQACELVYFSVVSRGCQDIAFSSSPWLSNPLRSCPSCVSPHASFAYNETSAQDFFPLTQEEALAKDWRWKAVDLKEYQAPTLSELPDSSLDVPDSITQEVLACSKTGKNYKITKQELDFYRRMKLPLPRLCPEERHKQRSSTRNPFQLWERTCSKTEKPVWTSYAPQRPEKIVSEEAFLEEMD